MALNKDVILHGDAPVKYLLMRLKLPVYTKGFYYALTAVSAAVKLSRSGKIKARDIYDQTAQIHNTTSSRVERDIRYCIKTAWADPECNDLRDFFGGRDKPPTNTAFIFAAANHIIMHQQRK